MFDDWTTMLPFRRPAMFDREWTTQELIRVDEYQENGTLVVRAELPGIDPDKDVEITVSDGILRIEAERRQEAKTEEKGYVRQVDCFDAGRVSLAEFQRDVLMPIELDVMSCRAADQWTPGQLAAGLLAALPDRPPRTTAPSPVAGSNHRSTPSGTRHLRASPCNRRRVGVGAKVTAGRLLERTS